MKFESFKSLRDTFPASELDKKVDAINYFIHEQIDEGIKRWSEMNGAMREKGLILLCDQFNRERKLATAKIAELESEHKQLLNRMVDFRTWVHSYECKSLGEDHPLCIDLTNELRFRYGIEQSKEPDKTDQGNVPT